MVNGLIPHTVNLHLKDFDIRRVDHQMGFVITGTPAGSGRLNIPDLLERVSKNGWNANVILELWPPYEESVEQAIRTEQSWLKQSIRYLRPYMECYEAG